MSVDGECIAAIVGALDAGKAVVLATIVGSSVDAACVLGRKLVTTADGTTVGTLGVDSLDRAVIARAVDALSAGAPSALESFELSENESQALGLAPGAVLSVFVDVMLPPEVLLIVGAGHIAVPLSQVGKILGFRVVVMDDRPEFANQARFPEADQIVCGPCEEELSRFSIGPSTYVIIVTRGHVQDEDALRAVALSPARYVGMIGSSRKIGGVLDRLAADGMPREVLDAVYTPIGVDFGAETPAEIAVSILGEVVNVRRRGGPHPHSMSVLKRSRRSERAAQP
jgi:xanthine dehydrogenase accessory factor